jgi:glutamine amidotransferase
MLAIIDYDAGNIKSVVNAFKFLGTDALVTRDPKEIMKADRVILPGVGAFGDAMRKLEEYKLTEVIRDVAGSGTPFMGICLGLQLLFDSSDESEGVSGLGILRGKIKRIPDNGVLKVPQIGWNSLTYPNKGRLFKGIDEDSYVYFVHSYYLKADDPAIVTATTTYGPVLDVSVQQGNVFATQFHPEKSSAMGLKMLENFLHIAEGEGK